MDQIDKEKYYKSLSKLDLIFRDISSTVTEISKWRCPYKNVADRCTAKFGCRTKVGQIKFKGYTCAQVAMI